MALHGPAARGVDRRLGALERGISGQDRVERLGKREGRTGAGCRARAGDPTARERSSRAGMGFMKRLQFDSAAAAAALIRWTPRGRQANTIKGRQTTAIKAIRRYPSR